MPPSPPSSPASELFAGRYRLGERLGRGGFGEVHAAYDERRQRSVAIKRLHDRAEDESVRRAFQREATLLESVSSPAVVQILDAAVHHTTPYLVMELLDGENLASLLRPGRLSTDAAMDILAAVLRGLQALHQRTILHGDLKPANVILVPERGAVLVDLGISRPWTARRSEEPLRGTPAYIAPELLSGSEVDQRTDLYGAGILFQEMLTGRRVFDGEAPDGSDTVHAITSGRRPPLSVSEFPDPLLDAFIDQATDIDPDRRFHHADAMLLALGMLRRGARVRPSSDPRLASLPAIAGALVAARIAALGTPGVRRRYLAYGGASSFLETTPTVPWVRLTEYCRFVDAAYGVLGRKRILDTLRQQVQRETVAGRFAAIEHPSEPDAFRKLAQVLPAYWAAAMHQAGDLVTELDEGGRLLVRTEGGPREVRTSPGWQVALSGALLGVMDAMGGRATVEVSVLEGGVTWKLAP